MKREMAKKLEFTVKQYFSIKPHYSASWGKIIYQGYKERNCSQPKKNLHNGELSAKAKTRLSNALNWMLLFAEEKKVYSIKEKKQFTFRINFITLTLSDVQKHSDQFIKKRMLQPFLKWLERSHNAVNYLWKAEVQDIGNIHFHITAEKYIHWQSIRSKWNKILAAHGYCKVFQNGTNDKGDAATQIKAVKQTGKIVAYIQGYMKKKDRFKKEKVLCCALNNHFYMKKNFRDAVCTDGKSRMYKRSIEGNLWGCSQSLSKINCFISESDEEFIEAKYDFVNNNTVEVIDSKTFEKKFPKKLDYAEIHVNSIDKETALHPLIAEKMCNLYKQYHQWDNGINVHEVESFN